MSKPTLSLCMIAKNEEDFLPRCLDSVTSIVDEMIVVDTGSTDNTITIAKEKGAKVFKHKWQDDFSKARNFALKKAKGDWILHLDADEEFASEDVDKLSPFLEDPHFKAYFLQIINCSIAQAKNPIDYLVHRSIRLFRNNPLYFYHGLIHEKPDFSKDKSNLKTGQTPLHIFHYGYSDAKPKKKKERRKRNIEMLKKALEKNPQDGYLYFYLGNEYVGQEEWQKALDFFRTAQNYRNTLDFGFQPLLIRNIATCLIELGRFSEALEELEPARQYYFDFPDLHYLTAQIYAKLGRYQEALGCFEECLRFKDVPMSYHDTSGLSHSGALLGVGLCCISLGQTQRAIQTLSQCLKINPRDDVALFYLGQALLQTEPSHVVREKLQNLADFSEPRVKAAMRKLFSW